MLRAHSLHLSEAPAKLQMMLVKSPAAAPTQSSSVSSLNWLSYTYPPAGTAPSPQEAPTPAQVCDVHLVIEISRFFSLSLSLSLSLSISGNKAARCNATARIFSRLARRSWLMQSRG